MSLKILFWAARSGQEHSNPASDGQDCVENFKIYRSSYNLIASTVFETYGPVWLIELDLTACAYPENQLQPEKKENSKIFCEIAHRGAFFYTMFLKVFLKMDGVPQDSVAFRLDPEMITEDGGPGTGPGGQDEAGAAAEK